MRKIGTRWVPFAPSIISTKCDSYNGLAVSLVLSFIMKSYLRLKIYLYFFQFPMFAFVTHSMETPTEDGSNEYYFLDKKPTIPF